MEIVLETTECSRQDPQWDACGMDVGGEDIDLLGLFEECHADELLSSVRDGFVEAETRPTSFDQDSSLKIRHDQHCDVNSLREQSSSPSSSDWASESSTQCHSNEQPPRHTLSLESCGGQKRVELVLSEAERADDKKRRNRDAARVCRAKKKRNIQTLRDGHEELVEDNRELKKENELLKGINAALEKQLAFFRTMFKDTCLGSGPLLPVSLPNSDKEAVTFAPQKPQGAGIALGMACLVAMYNIRSDLTLPAEPQRRGEALGGRPSRALLSIEDQSGPVMQLGGAACSLRWMLLLGLLAFCLVSMLESGASLAGKSSNAVSIFCIEGRRSWRSESCRTLHEKVHWLRRILTCLALKVMMPQY